MKPEAKPFVVDAFKGWLRQQLDLRGNNPRKRLPGADQRVLDLVFSFEQRVLFEDHHLLAINKPLGILSRGNTTHPFGALEVAQVLRHPRVDMPHVLPNDATGILLLAKHEKARQELRDQVTNRLVAK